MKNKYKNTFKTYDAILDEIHQSLGIRVTNEETTVNSINHILERLRKIEEKLGLPDASKEKPILLNKFISKRINETKSLILCPFHKEETPSCMIDVVMKEYYCFSCGAKGELESNSGVIDGQTGTFFKMKRTCLTA